MIALVLFALTFSSHLGLGDAPESVSGIRSLGILHAPGYPAYTLVARLWATLLPIGGWAAHVNGFSVACSVVAVVAVFVLGRLFGAARAGAALGALAVATSVSFWFNAGYAKHYALSAAIVALVAVFGVAWVRFGGTYRLVVAGALVGLGSGASWQLTAIMALAVVALVGLGERRVSMRAIVAAVGTAAIVTVAIWAFVVVRAGQDPAIDFGRPTNSARLTELLLQKDFLTGPEAPGGVRALAKAPHRTEAYARITVQEIGAAAVVLALVGLAVLVRRRRRADAAFFGVAIIGNLIGAIFIAGLEHDNGITSAMVVGGFLIDLMIVLGVLAGLGTTFVADAAAARIARRSGSDTAGPGRVRSAVLAAAALVVVVPSLVVHTSYASHDTPAFAERYARRVLDELPPDAVLVTAGWEYGQPIRYRQIVLGERPDVLVLSNAETKLGWYRDELSQAVPEIAPAGDVDNQAYVTKFIEAARRAGRPVFVDMSIIGAVGDEAGLRVHGDVAEIIDKQYDRSRRQCAHGVGGVASRASRRRLAERQGRELLQPVGGAVPDAGRGRARQAGCQRGRPRIRDPADARRGAHRPEPREQSGGAATSRIGRFLGRGGGARVHRGRRMIAGDRAGNREPRH